MIRGQICCIRRSWRWTESRDRLRGENDYKINLKAELEIQHLHKKIGSKSSCWRFSKKAQTPYSVNDRVRENVSRSLGSVLLLLSHESTAEALRCDRPRRPAQRKHYQTIDRRSDPLGRAIEPLLRTREVMTLRRSGGQKPLANYLKGVDSSAGQQRVAEFLETRPFPHYEAVLGKAGHLIRLEEDGAQTVGRFVDGTVQPVRIRK